MKSYIKAYQDLSLYPMHIYLLEIEPYNEALKDRLKQFPGMNWDPKIKRWFCGNDLLWFVKKISEKAGYRYTQDTLPEILYPYADLKKEYLPFQLEGIKRGLSESGILYRYSTGIGKTATAIGALGLLDPTNTLICCPGGVKETWVTQLHEWYAGDKEVHYLGSIKDYEKLHEREKEEGPLTGIFLTSYGVLKYMKHSFDLIIWDELHNLQSISSQRTRAAIKVSDRSLRAVRVGLTATPFHNEVESLYTQVNLLRPYTFGKMNGDKNQGSWYKYKMRYCAKIECEHAPSGFTFKGLSQVHKKELHKRIKTFTHNVNTEEVAHLLPKQIIKPIFIKANRQNDRALFEDLSSGKQNQHDLDAAVFKSGKSKIKHATKYGIDRLSENIPIAFISYHREHNKAMAEALTKALKKNKKYKNKKVVCIDGETKNREEVIAQAIKDDAILCATLKCISEGLNTLVHYQTILFVELHWDAVKMIQIAGRFRRLNSDRNNPVTLIYFIKQKTVDELILSVLKRRFRETDETLGEGGINTKLLKSLKHDKDKMMEEYRNVIASMVEDDYL